MSDNSLKNKTLSGLFWSFSDAIGNQGIQFILQIVLARLLVPKDFGVIGMITIFIAISQTFVDSGFSNALIREKKPTQNDYSTVFYFNLLMAFIIYIILFLCAEPISNYFKEPQLLQLIRILSMVLLIDSFGLIQRTILTKNINFRAQTKINLISSILSGIIAIILAYKGFGIWSLVIKTLIMQMVQTLMLCLTNRWLPSFVFNLNSFRKLFGFGWKLLVSGLINTLYNNLYYLIIGKLYSASELGYYSNAQRLRDTTSQSITNALQKVSYPVLSSIKEDDKQLSLVYKKLIKFSVFITFPLLLGLAAVAPPLIELMFGQKWINSISYFQILCFAGMLFPLHAINLNILQVKGRSDLYLGLEILKKVIGVSSIIIVLFFQLGIFGLLFASVIVSYLSFVINSYYSAKLVSYSTLEQLKDITPMFICALLMGLLVYAFGIILPLSNILNLIVQFIIGFLSYILFSKIFKIKELDIIYETLVLYRNRKKK
ncbi:lipopolysaccharide biosynthesis protein [Paenibacillus sp. FSL M7-0420]|uniref:lipopolysaccharide biosynthesis protein n=1 Tax=Paenibacillus sp. FSL M7-0420 TaxID=2921609 RepID=UPI0030F93839